MIKLVLDQFNASWFAEAALLMFAMVFIAIVMRTLLTRNEVTNQQAEIVLGDQTEKHA